MGTGKNSVLSFEYPRPWAQVLATWTSWPAKTYRIFSNKRHNAYLIFRATSAALIQGWRLFKGGAI